jgi:hypothetical protein
MSIRVTAVDTLSDYNWYNQLEDMMMEILGCLDCGTPYSEMGLDLVLPDEQWLKIHPEGLHGILCASCIMKRAEKIKGSTVVLARIDL